MKDYFKQYEEHCILTPGGRLLEVCGRKNNACCSIALVEMKKGLKGLKHYHDNLSEVYLFAAGEGVITINEHTHAIHQGDCFIIPEFNAHLIEANTDMQFACICTPYWSEEHEFAVEGKHEGNDIVLNENYGFILPNIERVFVKDKIKLRPHHFVYCLNGSGFIADCKITAGQGFLIEKEEELSSEGVNFEIAIIHEDKI